MNVAQSIQKLILILVILGALVFVGYTTIFGDVDISQSTVDLPIDDSVGQDMIVLYEKLNSVSIDTTVFSSPLFTNLVDISSEVAEEAKGRSNPFAPIGNDTSPAPVR